MLQRYCFFQGNTTFVRLCGQYLYPELGCPDRVFAVSDEMIASAVRSQSAWVWTTRDSIPGKFATVPECLKYSSGKGKESCYKTMPGKSWRRLHYIDRYCQIQNNGESRISITSNSSQLSVELDWTVLYLLRVDSGKRHWHAGSAPAMGHRFAQERAVAHRGCACPEFRCRDHCR